MHVHVYVCICVNVRVLRGPHVRLAMPNERLSGNKDILTLLTTTTQSRYYLKDSLLFERTANALIS